MHVCALCARRGYPELRPITHPVTPLPPTPANVFTRRMVYISNHVFITLAQSGAMTREELRDLLSEHFKVKGCIVAQETHSDTEGLHLHAACFGSFRSDRLAKDLHLALPGKHVDVMFTHKPMPGKRSGAKWSLMEMVGYLVAPKKAKEIDETPLIWIDEHDDITDADAFCDFYEEKFATATVKGLMQELKTLKAVKGSFNDAVGTIMEGLNKDIGFSYRGLIDYFQTLPPVKIPLTDEGESPRDWQVPVVQWALSPCPKGTDARGMWLHQDSGAGKTWVLNYIADQEVSIFRPGLRPHGGYDAISMMHYNGEQIILLDDIGCSTRDVMGEETLMWKGAVMDFLKLITSNAPIAFDFGGKRYEVLPQGKVLCTSNFKLPPGRSLEDGRALRRRFIELDASTGNAVNQVLNGEPLPMFTGNAE